MFGSYDLETEGPRLSLKPLVPGVSEFFGF